MYSFFLSGGMYMWILLLFAIIIMALSIQKLTWILKAGQLNLIQYERSIYAILFWGGISLMVGLFAHFHGIYNAMQAIARAQDISPAIVAEGYRLSLITVLSGMFLFIISLLIWFALRWVINKKQRLERA